MSTNQPVRDLARMYGREDLARFVVDLINFAVNNPTGNPANAKSNDEKMTAIRQILVEYDKIKNDKTLPYTWDDAKEERKEAGECLGMNVCGFCEFTCPARRF